MQPVSNHDQEICKKKKPFQTLSQAKKAAAYQFETHQNVMHAYRCPACKMFHIATSNKRKGRKVKSTYVDMDELDKTTENINCETCGASYKPFYMCKFCYGMPVNS